MTKNRKTFNIMIKLSVGFILIVTIPLLLYVFKGEQSTTYEIKETIQINQNLKDIDAVKYVTLAVDQENKKLVAHILVHGTTDELSKFATAYISLAKELNKGINKISLLAYTSQSDYENKQPSWLFEEERLSKLSPSLN